MLPSLPNELVLKILEHVDYKTITDCRRVSHSVIRVCRSDTPITHWRGYQLCRGLKDIVDTTASLRYIIELGAAGMCDGPLNAVGPAERLRKLEGSRTAWKSSEWSRPEGFPYSKKIFPYPLAQSGNLVVLKGPTFGSGEFLLLRFPSEARGIPEQLWYLDLDCEHIEAISLDHSQDLLVYSWLVANVESHLLTSLTGCLLL